MESWKHKPKEEYSKKTKMCLICSWPVKNCPGASLPLLKHTTKCYKILAASKSVLNPRSRQVPQFPLKLIEVQPKKPSFWGGSWKSFHLTEKGCGTFLRTSLRGFLWDLLPGVWRKSQGANHQIAHHFLGQMHCGGPTQFQNGALVDPVFTITDELAKWKTCFYGKPM